MPYVRCQVCGLRSYTSSRYSTDDRCPRCGASLRSGVPTGEAMRLPAISRHFVPEPPAAPAARAALDSLAGELDSTTFETLRLVATELLTNAIRHANLNHGSPVAMRVWVRPDLIRIEVHDDGDGFDPPSGGPDPDPFAESGRGLVAIDALAERWGVDRYAGTTVWVELGR